MVHGTWPCIMYNTYYVLCIVFCIIRIILVGVWAVGTPSATDNTDKVLPRHASHHRIAHPVHTWCDVRCVDPDEEVSEAEELRCIEIARRRCR
jgi:hypothetical protein